MPSYNDNAPCVYLVREPKTTLYKIGRTVKLSTRLSSLHTARTIPLDIVDLLYLPDRRLMVEAEKALHKTLCQYRVEKEWFNLPSLNIWKSALVTTGYQSEGEKMITPHRGRRPFNRRREQPLNPYISIEHLRADYYREPLAIVPVPPWRRVKF